MLIQCAARLDTGTDTRRGPNSGQARAAPACAAVGGAGASVATASGHNFSSGEPMSAQSRVILSLLLSSSMLAGCLADGSLDSDELGDDTIAERSRTISVTASR
jgi:hypothetical protein